MTARPRRPEPARCRRAAARATVTLTAAVVLAAGSLASGCDGIPGPARLCQGLPPLRCLKKLLRIHPGTAHTKSAADNETPVGAS
ncbi:hypothetical protein SAMN05421854_11063 [Amycolatopsis rubida]|uniref:Lipoprotein n=1 Tax=Amycolatopsis rubida TaxID=112413 RepID=A0A1I5X7K8_9PSEU|nr:hypothetical protein SAMN05421854_11063 [Amycolatopsis rubida]